MRGHSGWTHDRLKRAGFSSSPRRGFWRLTPTGHDYLRAHPTALTDDELQQLALGHVDVILRTREEHNEVTDALDAQLVSDVRSVSPDDRLEEALIELNESVSEDLLEAIGNASPVFFEGLVLDVLHAMGYGASRESLQRVGGSGDGGIDGIISLDRLGLERCMFKRNAVGRPEIQGFYGALAGQRAKKGVFITTSQFTTHAVEFARSVDGIVLLDGKRLIQLMIEFGVGVSHRTIRVATLDSDYFE